MKIARQFTGGNAQHQTPTASRSDSTTAAETWSRARPTHTGPQHRLPSFENRAKGRQPTLVLRLEP
jgi:hypothetical protein